MLTREEIETPPEDVHVATWLEHRVPHGRRVDLAESMLTYEQPAAGRTLGIANWVWIAAACLAAGCWALLRVQGLS